MGAGRHVHEVLRARGIEGVVAGELVEPGVDLLEVPCVVEGHVVGVHLGLRRHSADVVADHLDCSLEMRFRHLPRVKRRATVPRAEARCQWFR